MRCVLLAVTGIAARLRAGDPCACTGSNTGVDATKFGQDYGTSCRDWDNDNCASWWGPEKTGQWCCEQWCYVSKECSAGKPSTLAHGLFYLYASSPKSVCKSDTKEMHQCRYETQTYPNGGVAVPNLGGKPCRTGFMKVTGPMGNKYCAPDTTHAKGCVSQVDCEENQECQGEGTAQGGLCVTKSSVYSVHPHVLDATCVSEADCHEGYTCHGPGPNGKNNCVLANDVFKPCTSPLECPEDMTCKAPGYNELAPGEQAQGGICVSRPKYPKYLDTISSEGHAYVPGSA